MKSLSTASIATMIGVASLVAASYSYAKERTTGRGHEGTMPPAPVVFVTSQQLYYDSIVVVASLPPKGRFQQLIPGMNGLETDFGPGDVGHLGGRWWIDVNGDNEMDGGDKYFLCPLLGPGRTTFS